MAATMPRGKDKVAFTATIEHMGSGELYKKDTDCEERTVNENKVWFEAEAGDIPIKCSGLQDGSDNTGFVKLSSGKSIVSCAQQM